MDATVLSTPVPDVPAARPVTSAGLSVDVDSPCRCWPGLAPVASVSASAAYTHAVSSRHTRVATVVAPVATGPSSARRPSAGTSDLQPHATEEEGFVTDVSVQVLSTEPQKDRAGPVTSSDVHVNITFVTIPVSVPWVEEASVVLPPASAVVVVSTVLVQHTSALDVHNGALAAAIPRVDRPVAEPEPITSVWSSSEPTLNSLS